MCDRQLARRCLEYHHHCRSPNASRSCTPSRYHAPVHRFRHTIFNALTVLFLLLFAAIVGLWHRPDAEFSVVLRGTRYSVHEGNGAIMLTAINNWPGPLGWGFVTQDDA